MRGLEFSISGLEERQRRWRDERRGKLGVTLAVLVSLFVLAGREPAEDVSPVADIPLDADPPPVDALVPDPAQAGPEPDDDVVDLEPDPPVAPDPPATPDPDIPPAPQAVARLAANPTQLDFGVQRVGTASQPQTVTLSSAGTRDFSADYELAVADKQFVVTGCDPYDYTAGAAGAECRLIVTFEPGTAGTQKASLPIFEVDRNGRRIGEALTTLTFSGQASIALLDVTPAELDFTAPQPAQQYVTLRNTGTEPVTIIMISVAGENERSFRVETDECSAPVLAPGEGCRIEINRRIIASTSLSADLLIQHSAADSPARVRLTRVPPPSASVQANPASLDFGIVSLGSSSSLRTTITNVGEVAAQTSVVGFLLGDTDAFRVGENDCRGDLAPGTGCVVEVVFEPKETGSLLSTLIIAGTAVQVSGVGEAPAVDEAPSEGEPTIILR